MATPTPTSLRGLIASAHTPFAPSGRLDTAAVVGQLELFRECQVDGVFLCGTAGEGHSLTVAERRALLDTWVGATEPEFPIIVHVGHNCVGDAIELARHASTAGVRAIAAMASTYHRPASLEDLIECMAPIAAAAPDVPFLYYDVPELNLVRFPTDQILEWGRLRIPTLAGVNFSSRDLATYARCLRLGPEYEVLIGTPDALLPALACGGRGAIGASLGFAAPVYRRIIDAFDSGDLVSARQQEAKALELGRILREFGEVRASKAIMSLLGVDCGDVRLPLRPLNAPEIRALHERIRSLGLFARSLSTPAEIGR